MSKSGYYDGHKDLDSYTYGDIFTEKFDGSHLDSIHVKDLKFCNSRKSIDEVVFVPGKSFLAPATHQYYHMLIDVLGTYEFLKTKYKDLNIIFGYKDFFHEFNKHSELGYHYHNDIQKIYNKNGIIYDLMNTNVHFEEVIFFPQLGLWSVGRMVPKWIQDKTGEYNHFQCFEDRPKYMDALKNKFINELKVTEKRKIYSARIPFDINDPNFEQYNAKESEKYITRSKPYMEEIEIIKYFYNKGYEIINLENFTILEQFEMFYNASSVAGISGSNLFNIIWCSPETEIIRINTENWWSYQFDTYYDHAKLNIIDIAKDEIRSHPVDENFRVSSQIIIKQLDQYFNK